MKEVLRVCVKLNEDNKESVRMKMVRCQLGARRVTWIDVSFYILLLAMMQFSSRIFQQTGVSNC